MAGATCSIRVHRHAPHGCWWARRLLPLGRRRRTRWLLAPERLGRATPQSSLMQLRTLSGRFLCIAMSALTLSWVTVLRE